MIVHMANVIAQEINNAFVLTQSSAWIERYRDEDDQAWAMSMFDMAYNLRPELVNALAEFDALFVN